MEKTQYQTLRKRGVIYSTHIQSDGWQASKANGEISGTTGEAKRIEAIKIQLSNIGYTGSVQYSTHVQSNGWKNWVSDGTIGGTTGEAKTHGGNTYPSDG